MLGAIIVIAGCEPSTPYDVDIPEQMTVNPRGALIDAKHVLRTAAEEGKPVVQSQALEALAGTLGDEVGGLYLQQLEDQSFIVRFAAAMAVGKVQHRRAANKLLDMAENEPDKRVFAAVVYALESLGLLREHPGYAQELIKLLGDAEPEVRSIAAMAIGRMGEPSAIPMLKSRLADETVFKVQLNLVEAMALLGDQASAARLEAYTKGYFVDLRLAAIPAVARGGSDRAAEVLLDLIESPAQPPRVRVAAAGWLAELGHFRKEGYALAIASIRKPREVLVHATEGQMEITELHVNSLLQIAARALGSMGRLPAVDVLTPLLKHPDGSVRVAAAMGIVRLLRESTAEVGVDSEAFDRPDEPTGTPIEDSKDQDESPGKITPVRTPGLKTSGGKD